MFSSATYRLDVNSFDGTSHGTLGTIIPDQRSVAGGIYNGRHDLISVKVCPAACRTAPEQQNSFRSPGTGCHIRPAPSPKKRVEAETV